MNLVLFLQAINLFWQVMVEPWEEWNASFQQAGYQSFVICIVERILWCIGDKYIHGSKQGQCFLALLLLILFAVACCGRISSPILLRLCSELLAQALLICNELEEGLDCVLVTC